MMVLVPSLCYTKWVYGEFKVFGSLSYYFVFIKRGIYWRCNPNIHKILKVKLMSVENWECADKKEFKAWEGFG